MRLDEGNFLFLNAETAQVRHKIPPAKERFRLNRPKLLNLLSEGLDIQWGKHATHHEDLRDGSVKVHFKDGTTATGSLLVGADGNNSKGESLSYIFTAAFSLHLFCDSNPLPYHRCQDRLLSLVFR